MLEQERYSLQIKLGLKTQMEVDLMEEMDRLKLDLNNQKDKTNRIEAENMKTVTELKREVSVIPLLSTEVLMLNSCELLFNFLSVYLAPEH